MSVGSDGTGAVQDDYVFDAWGAGRSSAEIFAQPFRYSAREQGDANDTLFYRARFLIPSTGRFMSEDPLQELLQRNITLPVSLLNPYRYVYNSPAHYTDPTGFLPCGAQCAKGYIDAIEHLRQAQRWINIASGVAAIGGAYVGGATSGTWQGGLTGALVGGVGWVTTQGLGKLLIPKGWDEKVALRLYRECLEHTCSNRLEACTLPAAPSASNQSTSPASY